MQTRFSHSSLASFRQCPRKYKFEKIEKPEVVRKLMDHNYLGSTVHRQLRLAYQWAFEGKLYPLETALEKYEAEWEGPVREKVVVGSDHLTVDDSIAAGRKILTTFYERYQPFDQGTLLGAEKNINFQLPRCPATFNARVDRILKRDDGVVEIADYKTGKKLVAGHRDPGFRYQMAMYELAVRYIYPQFEKIEQAQYYLRHDEVIRYEMPEEELDELAEEFRVEVLDVHRAERLDDWPTHEGGLCDYCDYRELCPAKRHRRALEDEEGSEEQDDFESAAELADRFIEVDTRIKALKAEHAALKEDVKRAARDLELTKLSGDRGDVKVSIRPVEKFLTKSADPAAHAELSALVRAWEDMELCLKLDERALKEVFQKGRLGPEREEQLKAYLVRQDDVRVTVKLREAEDDTDE
jgi:putative RecB family exonuclease